METIHSNSIEFKYSLLQVSLQQYELLPSDLNDEQEKSAKTIAKNKCDIQNAVLCSKEAADVVVPESQVIQQLDSIIARFPSDENFLHELDKYELSKEDFEQAIAKELRVETVLDRIASLAPEFSEMDAKLHYHLHIDKYQQPQTRDARHILITINPDFPENTREEAEKRIKVIKVRLSKNPKRFSEQAKKHSECPTAMEGGGLGRVKQGVLFPTINKALFNLKENQVSEVIESPMGFHLVLCEKVYPEGPIPQSLVIPKIIEKMTERNQKLYQKQWLRDLLA